MIRLPNLFCLKAIRVKEKDFMKNSKIPAFVKDNYEIHEWKHASAILCTDFPNEWKDILALLTEFRLKKSWIIVGGGRKSKVAEHIDSFLGDRAGRKRSLQLRLR